MLCEGTDLFLFLWCLQHLEFLISVYKIKQNQYMRLDFSVPILGVKFSTPSISLSNVFNICFLCARPAIGLEELGEWRQAAVNYNTLGYLLCYWCHMQASYPVTWHYESWSGYLGQRLTGRRKEFSLAVGEVHSWYDHVVQTEGPGVKYESMYRSIYHNISCSSLLYWWHPEHASVPPPWICVTVIFCSISLYNSLHDGG